MCLDIRRAVRYTSHVAEFTIYREVTQVVDVATSDVLSRSRLRLYVARELGEAWKTSVAAPVIWDDPRTSVALRAVMSERDAKLLAEALGIDIPTLVARAEAHWRAHDEKLRAAGHGAR